jgi:hypothetical protein
MKWTQLYDPARNPDHWSRIIQPGEYCVFVMTANTRQPRDADGRTFRPGGESTAICADRNEAFGFANETVARHPELCAEIYGHQGKSGEALAVVYEPSVRGKYAGSRPYSKRETMWGGLMIAAGACFIVYDARHDLAWLWGYIVGLKLTLIGMNFLVRGLIGLHEHR